MIHEMLGQVLPLELGVDPASIQVPVRRYDSNFAVSDAKACRECRSRRAERAHCNGEVLCVNNNATPIAVVDFERYIEQFPNVWPGDRCDLLLSDAGKLHKKIVFCELCCNKEQFVEPNRANKYPQGKRAKARQQMERTIETLLQKSGSTTAQWLLTHAEKVCLFAWRDYDVPDLPPAPHRGDARASVQPFMRTASGMSPSATAHRTKMGHDFVFVQIKYPTAYSWVGAD